MVADDPLTAVVLGTGKVLDELSLLKDVDDPVGWVRVLEGSGAAAFTVPRTP